MLATVAAVLLQSLLEVSILLFFMIVVGNISWTFLVFIPVFALLAVLRARRRAGARRAEHPLPRRRLPDRHPPADLVLRDPDRVLASTRSRRTAKKFIQLNPMNAYVNAIRRGVYYLDLPTLTNWIVMVTLGVDQPRVRLVAVRPPRATGDRGALMTRDAIVVDHVSKDFRLHKDRATSLKELITRRDRKSGADQFRALDDVSLDDPRGVDVRARRPQRLGQVHAAALHRRHLPADERQRAATGRISTLLELGAGFHPDLTGRENVYMNATILGMSKKEIDRSVRRDRRVRRHRRVHRLAGEDLLERHVRAARVLGRGPRGPRDPDHRRGDRRRRHRVPAQVLRPPVLAAEAGHDDRRRHPRPRHRRADVRRRRLARPRRAADDRHRRRDHRGVHRPCERP